MATLQVVSSRPLAGKTAVAVALAQGIAGLGAVRLIRAGSGDAAVEDATTFADYLFAASPGSPVSAASLPSSENETLIVELEAGETLSNTAGVLVVRGAPTDADIALGKSLGERLVGTIATDVLASQIENVARRLTDDGLRPLAIIPEDRALAAPSVAEIQASLGAQVLFEGENEREVVEDVLIAPVYADPAQPHFRRFQSKAVLAPFNKTDLHLAAIETSAACLVITGGHDPSPYVIDRAHHGTTTVLLTKEETPETLASLSEVWLTSRFRGERKASAVQAHLNGRVDFAGLLQKL